MSQMNMICYASTLVKDGTTSSSDIGRLLHNSLDTHVATGTGHLLKIYKLARDDLLEEYYTIAMTSEIVVVKVVQVPGQTFDEMIVLTSEGCIFRVSLGDGQHVVSKIYTFEDGVAPDRKKFGVVREEGVLMFASSIAHVTFFDLSSGVSQKIHLGSNYLQEVVPLSSHHFATLESETKDSCVLKLHSINNSQHAPEDPMETSSMDLDLKEMGETPGYVNAGATSLIFEHRLPAFYEYLLPINKPFKGLLLFTDVNIACVPLPVDMNAALIDKCRDSVRYIQHPFNRLTAVHLNENGTIMVGTETGSLHLFSLVTDTNAPEIVLSIVENCIKHGEVTSTITSIRNLFFAGSRTGNSCWLSMENNTADSITLTRKQVFESFGRVNDLVVMPGLDRLKIIALCGQGLDSSVRVLQNCFMLKNIQSLPVKKLEAIHALRIGFVKDSWILTSTKDSTQLYRVTNDIVEVKKQNLFLRGRTVVAADVDPFVVQITPTTIHVLFMLTGPPSEGGMPLEWFSDDIQMDLSNSIPVIDVVGKRIVVATGKTIDVFDIVSAPDSRSVELVLKNSRTYAFNVACATIHTPTPDAPQQSSSTTTTKRTVHLIAGFSNSFNLLVIDLDTMITAQEIPLPSKFSSPKDVIAIGSDIVFSGVSSLYHVENFNPTIQTPPIVYAPQRVPANGAKYHLCVVNSETPGIFALSKDSSITIERWASRTTYPGVQGATIVTGFCGNYFDKHVLVYEDKSLSISHIYRRAVRIRLGDHATKLANHAAATFGVVTHRADYKDNTRNNVRSLTRQLEPKYMTTCGRITNRNTKWDTHYEGQDKKESCSILFFHVDTMLPCCTLKFSPYETARYIVSGKLDNTMNHYYVVSSCLAYPQKEDEARSSLYVLTVSGSKRSVEVVDQVDMATPGEPTSLHISNGYLHASINNREYNCQLLNGKLHCQPIWIMSPYNIPSAPSVAIPNALGVTANRTAVKSSTSEDILKGDYDCPSLKLASGATDMLKATAPLSETLVIAIGFGRDLTRMYYNQALYHDGSYFIPTMPTAIKKINLLNTDKVKNFFAADQVIFGTETGAIGFVLLLQNQWASIMSRVEYSIVHSPQFRAKYRNYEALFYQRGGSTVGFVDGDKLELLLGMNYQEIMSVLRSVVLYREDQQCGVISTETLLTKLQLFSDSLNIFYTGLTHE